MGGVVENEELKQQVQELSSAMKLVEHEMELEKTIRMYEQMFGTIIHGVYHEHHHTITYLQGRLAGVKHAMRVMDL